MPTKNVGIIFHNVISNYCLNESGFNLLGVLNGFAHLNRKFLRIFQQGRWRFEDIISS